MDSNEGPNKRRHTSLKLPKNPLKLTQLSMQSMQKKAGQDTFGGRFGGRKSSPETKLKHLRRHLRRPNPPNRAEHAKQAVAAKPPCKRFGGRMNLRLPNLSSSRTQLQRQTIFSFPSTTQNIYTPTPQHTYTHVYDHRGPKLSNNPKQQIKHNTETCIHA